MSQYKQKNMNIKKLDIPNQYMNTPQRAPLQQSIQPQAEPIIDRKKSPVKYRYLSVKSQEQIKRQWNIFWLESFAMFIFIYASTCSKEYTGIDLHFFTGILIAIPICAKQTGANLNPAVTYSMTFKTQVNLFSYHSLLWFYIKAQVVAAVLSMVIAVYINGVYKTPVYPYQVDGQIGNIHNWSILQVIISEAIGVFILILFILYGTGSYSFIQNNGAKYVYIAIFVYIGRKFAASSANQINLALTFSQAFVGLFLCDFRGFKFLIAWIIGDMIGVLLAATLYIKLVQPTLDYLQRHKTAKIMSKLKTEHQSQLKVIDPIKINQKAIKPLNEEDGEVFNIDGSSSFNRKIQYF